MASNQNIIRTYDAVKGTLINSRQLQKPFLASDSGCGDIPNTVGITGTPVIDPSTNIVYFFSKGYQGGAASGGLLKGLLRGNVSICVIDRVSDLCAARFLLYAVDITTLADIPTFPVLIDGHHAVNDPKKYGALILFGHV